MGRMPSEAGRIAVTAERCQRLLGETFCEFFDDDALLLRPDMTARDIDGWDSLAHVRLLLAIERKFQIRFSAPEIGNLQTIGDLASLIERKTNARGSAAEVR
jgi:acyl carrier protein